LNEPKKTSKKFVSDFDLVAAHYRLEELGELEAAKQAAREDMANAIPCYAALAREIRA